MIRTTVEEGIAEIWFDRPEVGNALDSAGAAELRATTTALLDRRDVRAVIVGGTGRHFCVGGDLSAYAGEEDRGGTLRRLADHCHAAIANLRAMDAPVIARVHGPAAGMGLSLVLAADLAVAADTAHFTAAYCAVGLSADGGQSWTLPRVVGPKRAAEFILTNRRISAREALDLGMLNAVVPPDALSQHVRELALRLAAGPLAAHGELKRLFDAAATASLTAHMDAEAQSIAALADSSTGCEGAAAFLEKRRPAFP